MTHPVLITFVPFPVPDTVAYNALLDRIVDLDGILVDVSPMRVGHGEGNLRDVIALSIYHSNIASLVGRLDNPFEQL